MSVVGPADHKAGWEYLYFAVELARGLASHQDAYLEYQSGAVRPGATPGGDPSAYLQTLTEEVVALVERTDQLLDPATMERAFGPPGKAGDEGEIRRVAGELAGVYAQLIGWGMKVRGAQVEERWRPVFAAVSKYVDMPLHQFQDFSATLSASVARVVGDIRAGRPLGEPLEIALRISLDPLAQQEFRDAMETLKRSPAAAPPGSPVSASPPLSFLGAREERVSPTASTPISFPPGMALVDRARQLDANAWFRRFGDIPGIDYTTPSGIDPTKIKGYGREPRLFSYGSDGEHHESLMWDYDENSSSASPVKEQAFGDHGEESVGSVTDKLAKGLELPGTPSDYHWLFQDAQGILNRIGRRGNYAAFDELERVCRLDLELIEAWPRVIYNEYGSDPQFYAPSVFGLLVSLYEDEGALHEALEYAERAVAVGANPQRRDALLERITAVDAEVAT